MSVKRIGVALPLIVLVGILGIFLLPWFIPHRQPVASASYTLGFNNMVATLAFAALLAAIFFYLLRRPAHGGGDVARILLNMLSVPESTAASRNVLIAFGATTTLTIALLLTRYLTLPYATYRDFMTDVTRLDLMVLGMSPYRDFQYNYGPALLYPAYWLYRLADGTMSIDAACCANLLAHWAVGLFLLYYIVKALCAGWRGMIVFLCCALGVFNLTMGVAYTPLRFLAPFASLLFVHRSFRSWIDSGTPELPKSVGLAVLVPLASLSISPEVGIATVAGTAAYFAALYFTPLRRYSAVALAPVISLGLAVILFSANYTEGLFSFGGGALNYPVLPTPHILLLVTAACLLLPTLGVIGVRERNQNGALAASLVLALGLMLAAAFGRCDPLHVLFNGLGIMVILLVVAVQIPSRATAFLTVGVFLAVHPALLAYSYYRDREAYFQHPALYRNLFSSVPSSSNEQLWNSVAKKSNNLRYGKLWPFQTDLRQLLQYNSVGTPLFISEDVDRFLKLSGRFFPEYYAGFAPQVFTAAALDRKIHDLSKMDIILAPMTTENPFIAFRPESLEEISKALFVPIFLIPKPRHSAYSPALEIYYYVQNNFTVIGAIGPWYILQRANRGVESPS